MLGELGKVPWTVPAMILIAIWRYTQIGHIDWMIAMATVFVGIRAVAWVRATLTTRERETAGTAGDGSQPARGAGGKRRADADDRARRPDAPDHQKEPEKTKSSGETWRRSDPK